MEKKLILDKFNNQLGLELGMKILEYARQEGLKIGISIDRVNYNVFTFIEEGLNADKQNWLNRKANVSLRFEESSLSFKEFLEREGKDLHLHFGLDKTKYLARGGSIPIIVAYVGLVGAITVTGLKDTEDHAVIVNSLNEYTFD